MHGKVIRLNYNFLFEHLDISTILPVLFDKDVITTSTMQRMESYQQKYAQSAILIDALLSWECPSERLLKLSDTLEVTPGQEYVGKRLTMGKYVSNQLSMLL